MSEQRIETEQVVTQQVADITLPLTLGLQEHLERGKFWIGWPGSEVMTVENPQVEIREKLSAPQVVLTLPLTRESREIVAHPELFWITSQSGTVFLEFEVSVREGE